MARIHLVGDFSVPYRGAELALLDLAELLAGLAQVKIWSATAVHPSYCAKPGQTVQKVQEYAPAGQQTFPQGGTVVIGGVHVPLGPWLAYGKAQRVVLQHNIAQNEPLYSRVALIERLWGKKPEIIYVSEMLKLNAGLPGTVHAVPMQLERLWSIERAAPSNVAQVRRKWTVGRHSADALLKHHPYDVALYRSLSARGLAVQIMGGTCLREQLGEAPDVQLWPTGHMAVHEFLQRIDVFFYRTDSMAETFGRVIFEALASGLPVVAQSNSGYTGFLHHGIEIDLVDDQESAFAAILSLCHNPELYANRSKAAREATRRIFGSGWLEELRRCYLMGRDVGQS